VSGPLGCEEGGYPGWLGERALKLLADGRVVALLHEMSDGPLRPVELERRLSGIGHAPLIERLGRLSREPVGLCERFDDDNARAVRYGLSERGRDLAEIVAEAARREQAPSGENAVPPGARALRLTAHGCNRAIARALAHAPLGLAELERSLPHIAHASLTRHLHQLCDGGAVAVRSASESGRMVYEPTAEGRRLALLVVLAARWEDRWAPDRRRPARSDVHGLVHVIAPLARVVPGVAGACRLHVLAPPGEPAIDLAAGAGRLSALALAPPAPLDAHGRATARAWVDALLDCDPAQIAAEGDRALLSAVVAALSTALRA
jgi:DNA-binding HxlR family transcriptional regulator